MKTMFLFLSLLCLCCGCYRIPTEDDYSVIPLTNNPDFTEGNTNPLPQIGY